MLGPLSAVSVGADDARMKVDVQLTTDEVEMCLTKTSVLQAKYIKQTAMRDRVSRAACAVAAMNTFLLYIWLLLTTKVYVCL